MIYSDTHGIDEIVPPTTDTQLTQEELNHIASIEQRAAAEHSGFEPENQGRIDSNFEILKYFENF